MSRILDALSCHARDIPEQVAITGSQVTLTWQQLAGEVSRLTAALSGVRALGLLMANSPAWAVTDLAAMRAAIPHIPLPEFFSDEQLQHVMQDVGIDTVITDAPGRIAARNSPISCDLIRIAGQTCYRMQLQTRGRRPGMKNICKVTYTSGTTGSPRGVCLTLDAIEAVSGSLATAAAAGSSDRAMALLPLAVLLENIGSVYVPLLAGAEIQIPDNDESGLSGSSRADPARMADVLHKYRPSTLIVPPAMLKLLVELARAKALPDSLRFIAAGGAPVGRELLSSAQSLGLPVFQGYGLSEACSVVAVNSTTANRPGSVGKPLPHLSVSISNADEIMVQGNTFAGYLGGRVRATGKLLATGDTGYLDADGYLYVTGRISERIITPFGRNVSPEWVEAELLSHPGIGQAAVIGNDLPALVAILVPATDGAVADLDEAVASVNSKMPDYARIDHWFAADSAFTAAGGELSAGGTPQRSAIEQKYTQQLDKYRQHVQENIL